MDNPFLHSWKEFADYLKISVRNAQRYEIMGSPVHRIRGLKAVGVFAIKEEIEQCLLRGGMRLPPQHADEHDLNAALPNR